MKLSTKQRTIAFVVALIVINTLAICFTLVDKSSYKSTKFYRYTRQRFAWIVTTPPPAYAIKAGWAKVNITPSFKTPIANNEASQSWTTVHDSIYTRAVVFNNGTTLAAMVTIDLLMMPPMVAQTLQQRLPKVGMDWKNIYLGATHSRHSLGGWANDYMSKKVAGEYDERLVSQLTDAIIKAIVEAKKNMAAVQIGYSQLNLEAAGTKIFAGNSTPGKKIHFLKLRKLTDESAIICSPEDLQLLGSQPASTALSRDGAGILTDKLEQRTGSFALFMAGPMDQSKENLNPPNNLKEGSIDSLVLRITPVLASLPLHTDSTLVAQTVLLVQNDPQVRITKNWRLKPWLARALYGDYPAELKALRIGKTVFVGTPGLVSGKLLPDLLSIPVAKRNNLVLTNFNGGNVGQIVPDTLYYEDPNPYDIHEINRFGPHTEAFFGEMVQSLVSSLK